MLKALPEQQMFVERTPRENAGGSDDYELNYEHAPEIDRYGARSMGTVHPAILGMLRRTNEYNQHEGIAPNLNLDLGQQEDRTMYPEVLRFQPERSEHAGMSIAQGPLFNRRMYDSGGQMGANAYQSEETHHNPERAARGGPFDQSRYASGHVSPQSFLTGYGLQPGHKITHPTREEMRG
jgi:hypothetical protein